MGYDVKQVIVVRKDLNMRKGKIAAQVAHASMKVLLAMMEIKKDSDEIIHRGLKIKMHGQPKKIIRTLEYLYGSYLSNWLDGSFAKVVVSCDSEKELMAIQRVAYDRDIPNALITDNGTTEFNGQLTTTCLAIGPYSSEELNKITGHLKLL